MAGHLAKGGHTLHAYDHKPVPASLLEQGAVACKSSREVAQKSDVIITMVQDTPHVASALFDLGGVAEGLTPGKVVVDMSSISPTETKVFAKRINEKGCLYLDAPYRGARSARRRPRSPSWWVARRRHSTG